MDSKSSAFIRGVCAAGVIAISIISSVGAESKQDWKPLFNGKNLEGWYKVLRGKKKNEDPNHLIQVHDGMIHMGKDAEAGSEQPFGFISTEKEYSDYHLRFEYKWGTKKFAPRDGEETKRDAGVLYHVVGGDEVWPRSVECQVQEGDVGDIFTVFTRVTASVDPKSTNAVLNVMTNAAGVVKTNMLPHVEFLAPSEGGIPFEQGVSGNIRRVQRHPMAEHDGWNTVEVIVRGDNAIHIINGVTNNIASNISQMVKGEWVPLKSGRITLQVEGAEVFYRNVQLHSLSRAVSP
jgi:hypothetical protein